MPKSAEIVITGYGNGLGNASTPETVSSETSSNVPQPISDEKPGTHTDGYDSGLGSQSSSKKANQSRHSSSTSSKETLTVPSPSPSRRTPILDPLDIDKICDPVPISLAELDSPSDCPASVPLSPIFTTRSNSPSSASSNEAAASVVHAPLHRWVQKTLSKETAKTLQMPKVDSIAPAAPAMASNEDKTTTKKLKARRRITLGGWERSLSSEKSFFPTLNSLTKKSGERIKLQLSESQDKEVEKSESIASMRMSMLAETIKAHNKDIDTTSTLTVIPPAVKVDTQNNVFIQQPKSIPLASSGVVDATPSGVTEVPLEKRTKDKRRRSLLLGRLGV
jgi:hypothetical protein